MSQHEQFFFSFFAFIPILRIRDREGGWYTVHWVGFKYKLVQLGLHLHPIPTLVSAAKTLTVCQTEFAMHLFISSIEISCYTCCQIDQAVLKMCNMCVVFCRCSVLRSQGHLNRDSQRLCLYDWCDRSFLVVVFLSLQWFGFEKLPADLRPHCEDRWLWPLTQPLQGMWLYKACGVCFISFGLLSYLSNYEMYI